MENLSSVFILDKNEQSRNITKSFIEGLEFIENIEVFDNYQQGYEAIKNSQNPIVIMDISEEFAELNEIADNIKLCTSKIIITSLDYSTNTIIKALRLGAKEFLPKPILKEDLIRVLTMLNSVSAENDSSQSKIISVYSNKGGIGKTTIAVNLAAELARVTKDKVALIDLNLQLGDISTFLNLNPPFDVNYVMRKLVDKSEDILIDRFKELFKEEENDKYFC